ncbi:MAG: response regulator [Desulfobacterales bacterium]|nr:response regulator [Desulfobacterales bacterium]
MAQKTGNGGSGMKNMMKVLIVDDDEALAGLIKEMIKKIGINRVKTAVNGEKEYGGLPQIQTRYHSY